MNTADRRSHRSAEDLAEYSDGLITDRSARSGIEAHLTGCAHCQDVLVKLVEVRAVLAAAPAPSMPASVTARLEAALAAEARNSSRISVAATSAEITGLPAHGADCPGGRVAAEESGGVRSITAARRRRARMTTALAAAATVATLAFGATIFAQLAPRGASDSSAPGAAMEAEDGYQPEGGAPALPYSGPTPQTKAVYRAASGQTFTAYTLSGAATVLLSKAAVRSAAPTASGGQVDAGTGSSAPPMAPGLGSESTADRLSYFSALAPLLNDPAGLARCIARIMPDPAAVQVLAIDVGNYGGEPAAMLVLNDPADPSKAQVRVVGTACARGESVEFLKTEIMRGR
ncbi:MAG: hypothetical protein L0Y54_05925 [Sporichthyaceae bacterium]|nr:hypothetical protein [Sporichthyaceae bacterium]